MLIHQNFVFIHLPKTGGTFVRKTLEQIYLDGLRSRGLGSKIRDKILIGLKLADYPNKILHIKNPTKIPFIDEIYGQHGGCNQIPINFSDLPIYSTIRNPFDYYYSLYKFKWWANFPILSDVENNEAYSNFPDLTFKEFLEYTNSIYLEKNLNGKYENIGFLTWKFVRFYCKKPYEVIKLLEKNPDTDITPFLFDIKWLYMEDLNLDLFNMLVDNEYVPDKIKFIKDAIKIRPNMSVRTDVDKWEHVIDEQDMQIILEKDRLLFRIFERYNP